MNNTSCRLNKFFYSYFCKIVPAFLLCITVSAHAAPPIFSKLNESMPMWAKSSAIQKAANSSDQVKFRVNLGLHNTAQAQALLQDISDPNNAKYGQYLTPAEFKQQFAPTDAEVAAVVKWLQSEGFQVNEIADNNHYISASGTVAQANTAFNISLNYYKHPSGMVLRSPDRPPSIPATLNVTGISGLDESGRLIRPAAIIPPEPPESAFVAAKPCSTWYGQLSSKTTPSLDGTPIPPAYGNFEPWILCGYSPQQYQAAYGVTKNISQGNNGAGVTVVLTEPSGENDPTLMSDLNKFSSLHGLPLVTNATFKQVNLPILPGVTLDPVDDIQGWYGEEALDVDAVHTLAPAAKIVVVADFSDYDATSVIIDNVVANNYGKIISSSWSFAGEPGQIYGDTVSDAKATDEAFLQGSLEGMTFLFSSGDNGDEAADVGYATPDWPASDPLVTAVGGTSIALDKNNNVLFQTGWESGEADLTSGAWDPTPPGYYVSGSGGGTSVYYPEPFYQLLAVPFSLSHQTTNPAFPFGRVVPDISMDGDPQTGFLLGQTQTFPDGSVKYAESRYGGTSLSSPSLAGILALIEQNAGHPYGLINPLLYLKDIGGYQNGTFVDILPPKSPTAVVRSSYNNDATPSDGYYYSLRTFEFDSFPIAPADGGLVIHTTPGYDDVTGIGSIGPNFIKNMTQ